MHLIARQDIPEGQEVLLSYGDRNNDDFFLHYGFVPLRNPHDDAVLFTDLTEALDWHYDNFYKAQVTLWCKGLVQMLGSAVLAGSAAHAVEFSAWSQRSGGWRLWHCLERQKLLRSICLAQMHEPA